MNALLDRASGTIGIARLHFADACASLWIDGELVHLEDLVSHNAGADVRAPTHELTIARDVLKTRRRVAAQPSDWALSTDGLRSLRGQGHIVASGGASETVAVESAVAADGEPIPADEGENRGGEEDPLFSQ
jgi:hypothetical protein